MALRVPTVILTGYGAEYSNLFPPCVWVVGGLRPVFVIGRIKRRWLFAALGGYLAAYHLLPGYHNIPHTTHILVNNL